MSSDIIGSDHVFTQAERRIIAAIAEATITAEAARGLPSAADPAVIAVILDKAGHFEQRIKTGIQYLCTQLDPLATASAELIEKLDSDARLRSFSKVLTIVIMQSYYQTPHILAALQLPAQPPFPRGHELEPDDWSLLETVKKRTPFYRPA